MPTYAEHFTLARDQRFRDRLRAALVHQALIINDEAWDAQTATPAQKRRRGLAINILNSPDAVLERFAWIVTDKASVHSQNQENDGALADEVNTAWGIVAFVSGAAVS